MACGIDPFTVETDLVGVKYTASIIILSVCKHFYEPGETCFAIPFIGVVDRVACLE